MMNDTPQWCVIQAKSASGAMVESAPQSMQLEILFPRVQRVMLGRHADYRIEKTDANGFRVKRTYRNH